MISQHIFLTFSAIVDVFKHWDSATSWNNRLTFWCVINLWLWSGNHLQTLLENLGLGCLLENIRIRALRDSPQPCSCLYNRRTHSKMTKFGYRSGSWIFAH